jgi:hypothetical protein
VCDGDPPLKPTNPSRTTCRLFVNSRNGVDTFQCSAWFVAPSTIKRMGFWYMVTAGEQPGGHCSLCYKSCYDVLVFVCTWSLQVSSLVHMQLCYR